MYALEDQLFAEYMLDQLEEKNSISLNQIKQKLKQHEWILNSFLNPQNDNFPEEDFHLALETDVFDFFPLISDGKIIKSS
jgi:phosphosulfolactate phosphohydrolase-like enzyme